MDAKRPKLFLGSDHAGVELKEQLRKSLEQKGYAVEDFGTHGAASVDYPDYAAKVGEAVAARSGDAVGILVCGTGIGVDIAANKVHGVRSARVTETFSARMARSHNDANVLCLGARVTGSGLAEEIVDVFLNTPFEGGRHQRRVDKLNALDGEGDKSG